MCLLAICLSEDLLFIDGEPLCKKKTMDLQCWKEWKRKNIVSSKFPGSGDIQKNNKKKIKSVVCVFWNWNTGTFLKLSVPWSSGKYCLYEGRKLGSEWNLGKKRNLHCMDVGIHFWIHVEYPVVVKNWNLEDGHRVYFCDLQCSEKQSDFGIIQTRVQILELSCNNYGTSGKLSTSDLYLLPLHNGRGK